MNIYIYINIYTTVDNIRTLLHTIYYIRLTASHLHGPVRLGLGKGRTESGQGVEKEIFEAPGAEEMVMWLLELD